MADEVGVAADRRGEVAVGARVQAGVAEVDRRVVGLLERAQDQRAQREPALPPLRARGAARRRRSRPAARSPAWRTCSPARAVSAPRARRAARRDARRARGRGARGRGRDTARLRSASSRATASLAAIIRCSISRWDSVCAGACTASTSPRSSSSNSGSGESTASAPRGLAPALQRGGGLAGGGQRQRPRLARTLAPRRRCDPRGRSPGARRSGSASGRTTPDDIRPVELELDRDRRAVEPRAQRARVAGERVRQHRLDGPGHVHARGALSRLAVERASRARRGRPRRRCAPTRGCARPRSRSAEIASSKSRALGGVDRERREPRRSRRAALSLDHAARRPLRPRARPCG